MELASQLEDYNIATTAKFSFSTDRQQPIGIGIVEFNVPLDTV